MTSKVKQFYMYPFVIRSFSDQMFLYDAQLNKISFFLNNKTTLNYPVFVAISTNLNETSISIKTTH